MTPDRPLLTRPRTAGEILDDAWRLALADFPLLFALAGLFLVPFFAVLLLLLTMPPPDGWPMRCLSAALVAILASGSGIGSGACQELCRRRTAGEEVSFLGCLTSSLRRGPDHTAARALILPGTLLCFLGAIPLLAIVNTFSGILGFLCVMLGIICLLLPVAVLWMTCCTVHTLIADGKGRRAADLKELGREARFNPAKTAAVVLTRLPLLGLGVLNLHLLGGMMLWAAGNLGGFDVALLSVALSLSNPVYLVALALFVWLLLTPYFEASNFLLHLDTRTRQEGLDLFYRVRRCFPLNEPRRAGVLLAVVAGLLFAAPVGAAANPVGDARADVVRIAEQVKSAEPYPGEVNWAGQLEKIAARLEKDVGATNFVWFRRRLDGFAQLDRAAALDVLTDLERRLARLERGGGLSKEELKGLLRPARDGAEEADPASKREKEKKREREEPPEVKRDVDEPPSRRSTSGSAPSAAGGGGSGGMLVGGLLLALLMAGLVLWFRNRVPAPVKAPAQTKDSSAPKSELPRPDEASAPSLWRKAEELAAKREYLEALRALYGAVLALLHRRHLIRYEVTRTNGEYVEQVRLAAEAPPGLRGPFERMTTLFEWKWYGERACEENDFAAGRGLAEEVRGLVV